jgi:pyruvate/2-oxoglutarate dehydrogenase complex dihydrolipoamide dehydrogenase (E3) component
MGSVRHFDLCIIGSGSGNSIVDQRFADRKVALVDQGTFGGTCLNVGCIPSKMYVYPASLAEAPESGAPAGRRSRPDRGALDRDAGPDLRPDRCGVRKRQGLPREE